MSPSRPSGFARDSRALSARLRELKVEKGLTYRAIAERSDLTSGQVSNLLNGRMENPPLSVLLALRRGFGVGSIEELLGPLTSQLFAVEGDEEETGRSA